ncbi:hypothetical protein [Myxococcus qinghaiensis]|uniref:hypothetical protein n=1 Tax=Myxococcus qinghaiensis TaxID=2906758 RepID=UPI0020A7013A|nr:hypothetical protein [Myxococcus qinghaiensis]MCP3163246.1 hypothetical protein [Myxococcus qinghaiensis]
MSREENARYLESIRQRGALAPFKRWMKWWPFLIVAYAVMYFMFSGGKAPKLPSPEELSRSGSQLGLVLLFGGVLAAGSLGFAYWKGQATRRGIKAAFLHPDVTALLAVYDRMLAANSRFPDIDYVRVSSRALAHAFYGDAASARRELASINWAGRPPVIRAMERVGEATIILLCEDAPEKGLLLAKEALSMVDVPSVVGASKARAYYEILVSIGELLTGTATPASLQVLEQHHQRAQLAMARLPSTWGLRVAYTRAGDTARAEAMREVLQREAPHCAPLHRIPA